jgi:hypothetical protein
MVLSKVLRQLESIQLNHSQRLKAQKRSLKDTMCSIQRSRYPTFLQQGKPELERVRDVPALTILAVLCVW